MHIYKAGKVRRERAEKNMCEGMMSIVVTGFNVGFFPEYRTD
jgi:hypothetical protein